MRCKYSKKKDNRTDLIVSKHCPIALGTTFPSKTLFLLAFAKIVSNILPKDSSMRAQQEEFMSRDT